MPTTITGTIVDAGTNPVTSGTFVRFELEGTQGIQPMITGAGALAPGVGTGRGWFSDYFPNASTGIVSGSVYSSRDATGLLAGEITVNGNGLACWWRVSIYRNGKKTASVHVDAKNNTTLDIGNLTARTPTLVQAIPPSTDLTYARLDGGNTPFTAIIQFLQGLILGAGKLLAWGSAGTGSVDTGISRTAAKTLAVGNGTQGDASGTLNAATVSAATAFTTKGSIALQKADGTLGAAITNDTAGGINLTPNSGAAWEVANGGNFSGPPGGGLQLNGATSGALALTAPAIAGSSNATFPANSGVVAELNLAQTWSANQGFSAGMTTSAGSRMTNYNGIATVGNGIAASYGQDDKTAQVASIGAVTLLTGTASSGGHWQWNVATGITTSDASGATYSYTINWTQDGIARSFTQGGLAFSSTATQATVTAPIQADNSTNITYSTTVTGSPSTGRYAIHVWVAKQ